MSRVLFRVCFYHEGTKEKKMGRRVFRPLHLVLASGVGYNHFCWANAYLWTMEMRCPKLETKKQSLLRN